MVVGVCLTTLSLSLASSYIHCLMSISILNSKLSSLFIDPVIIKERTQQATVSGVLEFPLIPVVSLVYISYFDSYIVSEQFMLVRKCLCCMTFSGFTACLWQVN